LLETNDQGETFGEWLMVLRSCDGPIDDLAVAAKADPRYPRFGSPDDMRLHLTAMHADREWFGVCEDAEINWLSN